MSSFLIGRTYGTPLIKQSSSLMAQFQHGTYDYIIVFEPGHESCSVSADVYVVKLVPASQLTPNMPLVGAIL